MMDFLNDYLHMVSGSLLIKLVLLCVVGDTCFGLLRAIKYRCWNSAIGIDGAIRKVGMVASVFFLALSDMMVHIDLLGFIHEDAKAILHQTGLAKVGLAELFSLAFVSYECTSILKNMLLCGLPLPKGVKEKAAAFLDTMTDESNVDISEEVSRKE